MKKIFRLFKFRLFRIVFVVLIITGGILFYQYRQNADNPVCKDCNLILISVDTLRPDHMGVYGYEKNTTPNIDKWAKGAIVFTNMRTQVPTTYPSFSVFMTGINVFESAIFDNSTDYEGIKSSFIHIDKSTKTLAEIFKNNGYTTSAFINNPAIDGELTNINMGFDSYKIYDTFPLNGPQKENKSFTTINEALKWIDKNKNKKFFTWIHLMEPHAPYLPTKEYYCKFDTKFCDLIKNQDDLWKLEKKRNQLKACKPDGLAKEYKDLFENLYDGSIASMDKLVGQILNQLEKQNLSKKSIVVFYGDHGEGFDHNYYFFHALPLYDSQVKIPIIIKLPPGLSNKGKFTSSFLQNTQIFPTLLELSGLSFDKTPYFKSFAPLFFEENKDSSNLLEYMYYVNSDLSNYAVQKGKYKFIYSVPFRSCNYNNDNWNDELYDLENDPEETYNIAHLEKSLANELKTVLFNYLKKYKLPNSPEDFVKSRNQNSNQSQNKNKIIEKLRALGY